MGQFVVMKKYRRLGVGCQAAIFIFDRFAGKWEVRFAPKNSALVRHAKFFHCAACGTNVDILYAELLEIRISYIAVTG